MDRNTRTLIVVLIALVAASAASFGVYQAIRHMPIREVEVASTSVVVASKDLPTGTLVTAADLKIIPWPGRNVVPGSFSKIDTVVNRGVIAQIQENEPITETRLAPVDGGAGLPPTIPQGMRAISVRVNEVVGVAGFAIPGTRVDVIVTLKEGANDMTRIVVSNVQVLTAGTRYDQEKSKNGEPIPSSVVTLLLTPEDAERVVLASTEGQIMLSLRNPLDVAPTAASGTRTSNLFGDMPITPKPQPKRPADYAPAPPPRPVVAPPPPPPAPPAPYVVEAIRAAKRSEETVKDAVKDPAKDPAK